MTLIANLLLSLHAKTQLIDSKAAVTQVVPATGIHVNQVSVELGNQRVLEDLSLDVNPGEIMALLGASGCGKSTLLRSIAGLVSLHAGEIAFSKQSRRAGDLAFVFQDATLLPWRTVEENVVLPLELGRRKLENREQVVSAALNAVGLTERDYKKFPRELSGGMRMRTSIARALVTDPSILLLDEPFAALDDILRTRLNELLLELWQQRQRTILFVTHNIAEAVFLSHRIAVFGKGRIADLITNPLPWPRTASDRTSPEFGRFFGTVGQKLAEAQT